eukprot:2805112-Amphidinium_carterae.1
MGPSGRRTGHMPYGVEGPEEDEDPEYMAFPANARASGPWAGQRPVTTKIPPGSMEPPGGLPLRKEAVEDWLDITELEEGRRGPALKARLEGAAYMYRAVLNRERLKAINGDGILKLHRGGQDINQWITRVEVVLDKAKNAWMELLIVLVHDADVGTRANDTVNFGRDPNLIRIVPDAAALVFARTELENEIRARHLRAFPIGENLQALMMIVIADLKEQQRELLMAPLFQRNMALEMLLPTQLTEVMRALLCQPKSSIENPSWGQQMTGQRSFLVIQQGECFGTLGYWVEDDETGEEGFLEEFQDTFWVHDEAQSFWIQRRFGGRFMRKSKGGKKGTSKSSSAIPGKGPPGPGQEQAHEAHDEEEDALAAKGKGAGEKKRNKKKKASAHEAEGTDLLPVQQSTSYQTSAAVSGFSGPATGDTIGYDPKTSLQKKLSRCEKKSFS